MVLVLIGQMLKRRQAEASWELSQKLNNLSNTTPETSTTPAENSDDWDAMWDEADAQIDEDFYHLMGTTAGVFKGIAIFLAAAAVIVFIISRVLM